ncbi:hypothetical protein CCM_06991 [Cordyceps militaris CM01]|uniref:Uncharacterized protein n=1 Tax=Cordyceps militaris (strain CM01) TaxID=983644 RepID=G3JLJ7_CORMM|nr:uncharacterized protein CCM_06991 [Cordyceps militaris CM01]EGX90571.1 hypothetical protein CCM_06991 [Cordyceps militaris CM01]
MQSGILATGGACQVQSHGYQSLMVSSSSIYMYSSVKGGAYLLGGLVSHFWPRLVEQLSIFPILLIQLHPSPSLAAASNLINLVECFKCGHAATQQQDV